MKYKRNDFTSGLKYVYGFKTICDILTCFRCVHREAIPGNRYSDRGMSRSVVSAECL